MIDQNTVDRIVAASDVVEVVKDFVSLRKQGTNYIGLCPFHNEKTPSFSVSPSKGIFKCFGCGKGGNAVNFIMEHEQMTYVEALKYLAKKYNIEVEEKELSLDELRQRSERESMMVVTAWAQRYFSDTLKKHSEGKIVALSYFRERGFRDDIIEKFQLGYCLDQRDAFSQAALRQGYKAEYLVKSGLSIKRDDDSIFDRFQGRVMFPVHSISGRVIAFGGRIMKSEVKLAKYINSPESEIYHKSNVLYGIFFAKKAITQLDKCYLVEGYTDVISLHQAGIENVVASSGTALTPDQIRLVKRFTPNITVLYDGDSAGIKASLRGIDLILEEGLNVKVVLLPAGEDPDSYARNHSSSEVIDFIAKNEVDFIRFKTQLLLEEAKSDPVKRANLIREIIRSIAVIPDSITRSVYIKECTKLLNVEESVLYAEIANQRRNRIEKILGQPAASLNIEVKPKSPSLPSFVSEVYCEEQEKEILFFLLQFGSIPLFEIPDRENPDVNEMVTVGEYIINEILSDDLEFKNLIYKKVFDEYRYLMEVETDIDSRIFLNHRDSEISQLAVNLLTSPHKLSKIWRKHHALPPEDTEMLQDAVPKSILVYKSKVMQMAVRRLHNELKVLDSKAQPEEINNLLVRLKTLNDIMNQISKDLERIVL